MAYELVEEVLDHAPEGLTPAERLVLVCIAEECRGTTRTRPIPTERIMKRTGLGPRGLRDACTRLESRGLRVRVIMGLDRRGHAIYAIPGRVCEWVLPVFPPADGCTCDPCSVKAEAQRLLREKEEAERRKEESGLPREEPQLQPVEPQLPPSIPFQFPSGGTVTDMRAFARAIAARSTNPAPRSRRRSSTGVPLRGTQKPSPEQEGT